MWHLLFSYTIKKSIMNIVCVFCSEVCVMSSGAHRVLHVQIMCIFIVSFCMPDCLTAWCLYVYFVYTSFLRTSLCMHTWCCLADSYTLCQWGRLGSCLLVSQPARHQTNSQQTHIQHNNLTPKIKFYVKKEKSLYLTWNHRSKKHKINFAQTKLLS